MARFLVLLVVLSLPASAQIIMRGSGGGAGCPTEELLLDAALEVECSGACSDGGTVSAWRDQSGNDRDLGRNVVSSGGPLYQTNEINSTLPVIEFIGTGYFDVPNFLTGFTAAEIFVVVKVDADPASITNTSGLWILSSSGSATHFPWTDGNIYLGFGSTDRKTVGDPTPSLSSAYRLLNVRTASGAWSAHLDTTQIFTTGTNTVGWPTSPLLGSSGEPVNAVMKIAEVRLFSEVLSSDCRAAVETALDNKYALSY